MNLEPLYLAAQKAQQKAYAPYSNFKVGVAILDENNAIHSGCNVENAAYPIGCCAEQSAVSQMVLNAGTQIQHILILGKDGLPCPPCGACRQIIAEHGNDGTQIHLENTKGEFTSQTIKELLPNAFDHRLLDK